MHGFSIASEHDYKDINGPLLKRLLKYLKPYRKIVLLGIFLTLFTTAIAPLRPYLIKIAIDENIINSDWTGLLEIIIFIFLLIISHGLLQFLLSYLMQWVGQKVLLDIRIKLFDHIQRLSIRFYDKNPVGRLVTRVTNDVEVLNELFSTGVVMVIADLLLIFWIIGYMFFINWELALLSLTVLPLLIVLTIIFRKKVRIVFREIRLKVAQLNSFLNEFINGISTVKLFTQEQKQANDFDEINKSHTGLWVKSVFYYALFFPSVDFLSHLSLGIILLYTSGNIIGGFMTVGTLIAFLQYAEMFFRPIRDLTEKYTILQSAMASAERIFGMLDTEDFTRDSPDAEEMKEFNKSIEFKNVGFTYDSNKWVLNDLSFEVKKGETVAIVGITGAGKTSVINLLCRFYDFQKGRILIDDKDICHIKMESLRKKIALVSQDVFLFSRSIASNISLGTEKITDKDIENAAKSLGASGFIKNLPDGYNTDVMERGAILSAGQKQLIAFCRAFAANPEILILDEATSNIDSETEIIIEKSLEKLLANRTSIVIAHRLSTIRRADKVVVLHHGNVKETGTHKELLEKGGIYSKLHKLQYG